MSASNGELIVSGQQRDLMIQAAMAYDETQKRITSQLHRLPVLGSLAVIVVMIFNCGVAIAGPNHPSADYIMPGCRDAASLITFSNVGESEEQVERQGFCEGVVVGLSFMGQPYGICVPAGTTSQQITSIVVQYIDGQPQRIREDFNHFAVEALRANWPCSIEAGARDPLAVVLH